MQHSMLMNAMRLTATIIAIGRTESIFVFWKNCLSCILRRSSFFKLNRIWLFGVVWFEIRRNWNANALQLILDGLLIDFESITIDLKTFFNLPGFNVTKLSSKSSFYDLFSVCQRLLAFCLFWHTWMTIEKVIKTLKISGEKRFALHC